MTVNGILMKGFERTPETGVPVGAPTKNEPEKSKRFDLSQVLCSERYLKMLELVPAATRPKCIGVALEYGWTFPDGKGFWEFTSALVEQCRNSDIKPQDFSAIVGTLFAVSIRKKFDSSIDNETEADKQAMYEFLVDRWFSNGAVYHGFNGAFEPSIRRHGLTTGLRNWDWDELKEVHQIFQRSQAYEMVLGWGMMNSEIKTSVATATEHLYRYAVASPEWFAQFCSEGFHIPVEGERKTAFYRRDYTQARQNIVNFLETTLLEKRLNSQEQLAVLKFFDHHWFRFVTEQSAPKVATIHRRAFGRMLGSVPTLEEIREWHGGSLTIDKIVEILRSFATQHGDSQIQQDISPHDVASIITLPDYSRVRWRAEEPPRPIEGLSGEQETAAIAKLLGQEPFSARAIIELLKHNQTYRELFEGNLGGDENFTLEQHVEMVCGQFEKYFSSRPIPLGLDKRLFRLLLIVHDLGKPRAVARHQAREQHNETLVELETLLPQLGLASVEQQLIQAIVSADPIGQTIKGGSVREAAEQIAAMAQAAGVATKDFFDVLLVYYSVDASSYTADAGSDMNVLGGLFQFYPEQRRMEFSSRVTRVIDELRQAISSIPSGEQKPEKYVGVMEKGAERVCYRFLAIPPYALLYPLAEKLFDITRGTRWYHELGFRYEGTGEQRTAVLDIPVNCPKQLVRAIIAAINATGQVEIPDNLDPYPDDQL